ncbi:hypothetical protein [Azonexus hydrophilus]|uniref:O-antigen polymerase n=1 Tax=Azonexus hydrophilus TaxID=418702 RepID=A0ABZ2XGN8_9RHOO
MELTYIGAVWLVILLTGVLFDRRFYFIAMLVAAGFYASAFVNFGEKGVSVFVVSQIVFIARFFNVIMVGIGLIPAWMNYAKFLLVYCFLSIVIAPLFFSDLYVFPPDQGMDIWLISTGMPLDGGWFGIYQAIYLMLNFVTVYICFVARKELISVSNTSINLLVFFIVLIGWWELSGALAGVWYPRDFFVNNSGFALLAGQELDFGFVRLSGAFPEPSYFGAVISGVFWYLFSKKNLGKLLSVICVAPLIIYSLSGSAVVSFITGALIWLYLSKKHHAVVYSLLLIILIIPVYGVLVSGDFGYLFDKYIFNKLDSTSTAIRVGVNNRSWELLFDTYGFGVGFGNHRSSSALLTILATIGFYGLFFYMAFIFDLIVKPLLKCRVSSTNLVHAPIFAFFGSIFGSMLISIPDVNFYIFWALVFMVVVLSCLKDVKGSN